MTRPPPSSPPSPHTPLFRPEGNPPYSRPLGPDPQRDRLRHRAAEHEHRRGLAEQLGNPRLEVRSEEHTSELQSRHYLVCRLLLAKKKTHNVVTTVRTLRPLN